MAVHKQMAQFEELVLPHLDAAYNLARWLARNEHDAEDIVQEACLRAFRFFDGFRGRNSRAWLLAIVRNTFYTWFQQNRSGAAMTSIDEEADHIQSKEINPEMMLVRSADIGMVRQALDGLPPEFREILVLRELEGFSYKEIADIADLPLGTVMSRLARARERLQQALATHSSKEAPK